MNSVEEVGKCKLRGEDKEQSKEEDGGGRGEAWQAVQRDVPLETENPQPFTHRSSTVELEIGGGGGGEGRAPHCSFTSRSLFHASNILIILKECESKGFVMCSFSGNSYVCYAMKLQPPNIDS